MDKLIKLASLCKAEVSITINPHRNYYQTIEEYLIEINAENEEIGIDVLHEMIIRDTLIEVQFYPHTPIGFYTIYHYDIEKALSKALAVFETP